MKFKVRDVITWYEDDHVGNWADGINVNKKGYIVHYADSNVFSFIDKKNLISTLENKANLMKLARNPLSYLELEIQELNTMAYR